MLTIRLQRVGRTNDPSFRVVVTDSKNGPKSGKFLEIVGFYNPKTKDTRLDEARIKHWIAQGATTSGTLHNLLITKNVIEGKKVNVLSRKTPIKKEEPAPAPVAVAQEAPQTPAPEATPADKEAEEKKKEAETPAQ